MAIKLNGSTSGSVALDAPADTSPSGTDVTLTLPTSAGSSGQYLQTNGSGTLSWQTVASLSNAEDGTGTDFEFNSGFGSNGVAYGCRAWVNFQGSGTVTIRDNGNVSSITDNGGADYTLNFTSNMPDVNYCPVFGGGQFDAGTANFAVGIKTNTNTEGPATLMSTSQLRILAQNSFGGNEDLSYVCVAIFR